MSRWTCPTCRAVFDDQGAMKDHAVMVHRDHDANVAAVLDKLRDELCHGYLPGPCCCEEVDARRLIDTVIDAVRPALSAAGYAVVKLPEGVEVEHGARLVPAGFPTGLPPLHFFIEPSRQSEATTENDRRQYGWTEPRP